MLMSRVVVCVFVSGLLFISQAEAQQKVSVGAHYYSGDYNQDETTTFSFIPVSWSFKSKPWKFKVSTSWVRIDGPGDVKSGSLDLGYTFLLHERESGLGDVRFSATYQFQNPLPGKVWVDAGVTWKLPTANEGKGLGTGEADQKFKLDFIKLFSEYYGLLTLSYNKRGDPEDVSLKGTKAFSLGFSRNLKNGHSWGGFFDYRTVSRVEIYVVDENNNAIKSPNSVELSAFYALPVSQGWKVSTYGLAGLNDSSTNYGLGIQASYKL